jgi:hypothetical protein
LHDRAIDLTFKIYHLQIQVITNNLQTMQMFFIVLLVFGLSMFLQTPLIVACGIFAISIVIWLHDPKVQSKTFLNNDFREMSWQWKRNLITVRNYPMIIDSIVPENARSQHLSIFGSLVSARQKNASIQAFKKWKSEFKRKKFMVKLRHMSEKESNSDLLESIFLRFKTNIFVMQRNFLLTTIRLAQDSVDDTKFEGSGHASMRQTVKGASFDLMAENSTDFRKPSETSQLFPASRLLVDTTSNLSPVGEETNSSQVHDAQNPTKKWAQVKELEELVARLEYELQCKESQLDIMKREAANLKKSLVKRPSNASSVRNGMCFMYWK